MPLWGIKDSKTASGTIDIAANGDVTGTGTSFTTQVVAGDYLVTPDDVHYLVIAVSNNTIATVKAGNAGGTVNAVSGQTYSITEKPVSLTEAEALTASHGQPGLVYGVDTGELQAERAAGAHPTHSGWVRRVVGTGGRAGRVQYETLVAMGRTAAEMGDLEDTVFEDYLITIATQPADATANGAASEVATFSVGASSVPDTTLTYTWYYTTEVGNTDSYALASNSSIFTTNATSGDLEVQSNSVTTGTMLRVVVSATGADSVTSSGATLTVT